MSLESEKMGFHLSSKHHQVNQKNHFKTLTHSLTLGAWMLNLFLFISLPILGFCQDDLSSIIWKSTYSQAIPNQINITQAYCDAHTPGTFVGVVKDQLVHGAITDRQIKLHQFTFHQKIKQGIYFMEGSLLADSSTNGKAWQDHIHYYVYKLTERGATMGVWNSGQCKGLYFGEVIQPLSQ